MIPDPSKDKSGEIVIDILESQRTHLWISELDLSINYSGDSRKLSLNHDSWHFGTSNVD